MRVLQLHSDFIDYRPINKENESAEEAERADVRIDDAVVLFTTVEEGDNDATVSRAVEELGGSIQNLRASKIVIYPYSHLSSNLAPPQVAIRVLKDLERGLREVGYEVHRSPFGWTKSFRISVKGHPLSEQARTITAQAPAKEQLSQALGSEEKLRSQFFVLAPDGALTPVGSFDFKGREKLRQLMEYEVSKSRGVQSAPPHVQLMKRLGLADYEPGSDPGNLRFYPRGRFVKSLLEKYVTKKVREYGALEVETPIMYDSTHPSLADYLDRFPARQYRIKSDERDLFLRFSACFGQFLMLKDAQFSHRQLPLKIYELTRYSFRREKSGELVGLRRLRAFTMPDCHAICRDMGQAKAEVLKRFELSRSVLGGIGLDGDDYELAIRITKEFYEESKELIESLIEAWGRPAILEIWEEKFFYFVFKWEFNFVDSSGKASALSTDQIDVENATRYGIAYIDEKGEERIPVILHNSPSGAIERCIYALLEREAVKDGVPALPFWLSPTQVRMVPISKDFLPNALEFSELLERGGIRVDVDDRDLSVGKKVREAETEWIRFIVVIGKKEAESKILQVRDRDGKNIVVMSVEELVAKCRLLSGEAVFDFLPLPKLVSQRPQFA